jgi:hypothetical protein
MLQKALFDAAQTFDGYLRDKEHYAGDVRMKLVAIRDQMEALRQTLDHVRD